MSKKILVCGATGFMGQNIVKYFSKFEEYEVYGVGLKRTSIFLPKSNFFQADLTLREEVNRVFGEHQYDIVIQAAANTSGSKDIVNRPYLHVTDNAVMNAFILQACYDYNVGHFLFLSCGVMYNPSRSPVSEKDFYFQEEMHKNYFGVGWTKVYIEKMCEFYSKLGKTKHTAIRHSNTYGPYDKYDLERSHIFGATITKVLNANEGDEIVVWGDGSTERDLLYVSDVVDFIQKAIEEQQDFYKLYNVGSGKSISVRNIVEKIVKIAGKCVTIKQDLTKPSINTKLALISHKAQKELGWKPQVSLDVGIKKTIDWYKAYYHEGNK